MILTDPRLVLIGVGSSELGYNSVLDAANLKNLRGCNLVLHDINAKRLETMGSLATKIVEETPRAQDGHGSGVQYRTGRRGMIKRPPKPYLLIRNEKWLGTFCTFDQMRHVRELSKTQGIRPIRIEIEEGEEKQNLVTLYLADGLKVTL